MRVSAEGLAFIKREEGLPRKNSDGKYPPYLDRAAKPPVATIGYGMTHWPDGRKVSMDDAPITIEEADDHFRRTLQDYEMTVTNALTRKPTQAQFDAMVSLCWNIGRGGFQGSTVVKRYNAGDIVGAAEAFAMWNKTGGQPHPVLTARRAREAAMFLGSHPKDDTSPPPMSPQQVDQPRGWLAGILAAIFGRRA